MMSMPAIPLFISSRWHKAWKKAFPMHIKDWMTVQQKAGEKVAPIDFPVISRPSERQAIQGAHECRSLCRSSFKPFGVRL